MNDFINIMKKILRVTKYTLAGIGFMSTVGIIAMIAINLVN